MTNFVSSEWLAQHILSPDIIVIDCRFSLSDKAAGQKWYVNDHITGAHYADLETDFSGTVSKHGGRHPLPDVNILSQFFGSCGISSEKIVVAYDDSQYIFASRLWWLLRYLGHDRVVILKDGYTHYKEKGLPVSTKMPEKQTSVFKASIKPDMIVNMLEVRAVSEKRLKDAVIIDSREEQRYAGLHEPIDHQAGHIPGSINLPFMENFEDGKWKTNDGLNERFSSLENNGEKIVYCGSGITACVNILALEEIGMKQVKLYPGSWSDWISYSSNQIGKSN
ncbi:sulfurtransferase [Fictibacillus iocasae]|uniref:Sulfurtransferase n=1 Tax=Fictibacillus iocasae TaxID=2715437 RepID=A0ABW2NJ52_9BACL